MADQPLLVDSGGGLVQQGEAGSHIFNGGGVLLRGVRWELAAAEAELYSRSVAAGASGGEGAEERQHKDER